MQFNLFSCGDAIELMSKLPDGSIDMILTDPPQDKGKDSSGNIFDATEFWKEVKRITKKEACIAIWSKLPAAYFVAASMPSMFRYEWIVENSAAAQNDISKKYPSKMHDNVLIFYRKAPVYTHIFNEGSQGKIKVSSKSADNKEIMDEYSVCGETQHRAKDVIRFDYPDKKALLHPAQKPLDACVYFIKTYTKPGMVVLDPYAGSGTTGLACKILGRKFIGFELEKDISDIAINRIATGEVCNA